MADKQFYASFERFCLTSLSQCNRFIKINIGKLVYFRPVFSKSDCVMS